MTKDFRAQAGTVNYSYFLEHCSADVVFTNHEDQEVYRDEIVFVPTGKAKAITNFNASPVETPDCFLACLKKGLNNSYAIAEGIKYLVFEETITGAKYNDEDIIIYYGRFISYL